MAPYAVPPFYDSLLGKIIVRGRNRTRPSTACAARSRKRDRGREDDHPFHLKTLSDPKFIEGRLTTADSPACTLDRRDALRRPRSGGGARRDPR